MTNEYNQATVFCGVVSFWQDPLFWVGLCAWKIAFSISFSESKWSLMIEIEDSVSEDCSACFDKVNEHSFLWLCGYIHIYGFPLFSLTGFIIDTLSYRVWFQMLNFVFGLEWQKFNITVRLASIKYQTRLIPLV